MSNRVRCSICLEGFSRNSEVRQSPPCKHIYHGNCIDLWLKKEEVCPVCKVNLDVDGIKMAYRPDADPVPEKAPVFDAFREMQNTPAPFYPVQPNSNMQSQQQQYEKVQKMSDMNRRV